MRAEYFHHKCINCLKLGEISFTIVTDKPNELYIVDIVYCGRINMPRHV